MSLHAMYPCPTCPGRFAFPEYHYPHCPGNPKNLSGATKEHMERIFSKSELEQIAAHGAVADQPIAARRAGKSNRHSTKAKSDKNGKNLAGKLRHG